MFGHRGSRLATVACVLATAAVWVTPAAPASAAEAPCPVEMMDAPAGGNSVLLAGDPSGAYQVGLQRTAGATDKLVRWQNGTPQVDVNMGVDTPVPTGVNRSGRVVGYSKYTDSTWSAWQHDPGNVYTYGLPAPDGRNDGRTVANAINDNGWSAGGWTNPDTGREIPLLWSPYPNIGVGVLPLPEGYQNAVATGIDSGGRPVGHAYNRDENGAKIQARPMTWTGYDWKTPLLLGASDPAQSFSDEQLANGYVVARDDASHLAYWDSPYDLEPDVLADGISSVQGYNERGSVLLTAGGTGHAVLRDGQLRALEVQWGTPTALADDDVVYGYLAWGQWSFPARWECGGV